MDCSIIIEDKPKLIDTISKDESKSINSKFIKLIITNCFPFTFYIHFIQNKVQKIHRNAFKNCKSLINARFIMGNLEKIILKSSQLYSKKIM